MLESILNHLLFFGGSLAFIMAFAQFLQIFRHGRHLWLGIFFSCISIIGFHQYYFGVYDVPSHNLSQFRGQMVLFMLGPSIFFFYKKLFFEDFTIQVKHIVHFIPPLISLCIDAIMFISKDASDGILKEMRTFLIDYNFYYITSAGLIFIGYNLHILTKEDFISLMKRKMKNKVNQVALTFVVMVLLITILLVYAVVTHNVTLGRFFMTLMIVPFAFILLVGYLNPEFIHVFTSEVRKNRYERSLMRGLDVDALKMRLEDLMTRDKVFCDEDLGLKRLSDMLSISPHQLSEFLNKHLNISFNDYVNKYRVAEAIDLMQAQPDRAIASICFSVGFNSKSAFYEAFAKFVGISPARYRKKHK
ncbi:MAG: AraC family transcriptional regulator [Spirochaetes bacterium]|nr:AraC family transcriptional regulator [Spirochaetota bacterium]